jgi:hypothetical protein
LLLFLRITRSASSDVAVVHITDPCVEDPGVPQACELECRRGAGERELFPAMVRDPFGNAFQIAHRLPSERHSIDSNVRLPRSTLKQN